MAEKLVYGTCFETSNIQSIIEAKEAKKKEQADSHFQKLQVNVSPYCPKRTQIKQFCNDPCAFYVYKQRKLFKDLCQRKVLKKLRAKTPQPAKLKMREDPKIQELREKFMNRTRDNFKSNDLTKEKFGMTLQSIPEHRREQKEPVAQKMLRKTSPPGIINLEINGKICERLPMARKTEHNWRSNSSIQEQPTPMITHQSEGENYKIAQRSRSLSMASTFYTARDTKRTIESSSTIKTDGQSRGGNRKGSRSWISQRRKESNISNNLQQVLPRPLIPSYATTVDSSNTAGKHRDSLMPINSSFLTPNGRARSQSVLRVRPRAVTLFEQIPRRRTRSEKEVNGVSRREEMNKTLNIVGSKSRCCTKGKKQRTFIDPKSGLERRTRLLLKKKLLFLIQKQRIMRIRKQNITEINKLIREVMVEMEKAGRDQKELEKVSDLMNKYNFGVNFTFEFLDEFDEHAARNMESFYKYHLQTQNLLRTDIYAEKKLFHQRLRNTRYKFLHKDSMKCKQKMKGVKDYSVY